MEVKRKAGRPRIHPLRACVKCGDVSVKRPLKHCSRCNPGPGRPRKPGSVSSRYTRRNRSAVIAELRAIQGDSCAVCGAAGQTHGDGIMGLVLDHCHATGDHRGLLCTRCNTALGWSNDDPTFLRRLAEYLEIFKPPGLKK